MGDANAVLSRYRAGESIRQISTRLGLGRRAVRASLDSAGIEVAPYGQGRARPGTRLPRPAEIDQCLHELYVVQRLTRKQVADALGVPDHQVRTWLEEGQHRRRTRGWANREDRQRLDRETLECLYVERGLTAAEIGERTGALPQHVLAALHDQGLPVRIPNNHGHSLVILSALYDDDLVATTLNRHGIPIRRDPGPLTERFPVPVHLTHQMLDDLYLSCGLSVRHIELLTGQPATTVIHWLQTHGMPLRPAGGLSPFLRRIRDSKPSVE